MKWTFNETYKSETKPLPRIERHDLQLQSNESAFFGGVLLRVAFYYRVAFYFGGRGRLVVRRCPFGAPLTASCFHVEASFFN
jgi:hypothetical protein